MYFVPYLYGGRSPPYTYNTKYTRPLRVFDTPLIPRLEAPPKIPRKLSSKNGINNQCKLILFGSDLVPKIHFKSTKLPQNFNLGVSKSGVNHQARTMESYPKESPQNSIKSSHDESQTSPKITFGGPKTHPN